jgi:hypothetical protein
MALARLTRVTSRYTYLTGLQCCATIANGFGFPIHTRRLTARSSEAGKDIRGAAAGGKVSAAGGSVDARSSLCHPAMNSEATCSGEKTVIIAKYCHASVSIWQLRQSC